ncbi:MAG: hypothetical protein A2V85_16735 [Chloroflexi bacterium RBG_16_72_14]|nr:MAG: hypothetical protein A2V85_16735 [Chloroflexi bacterium RBG_16_72_14]
MDRRFAGWALAWTAISLVSFGLVTAIIPNPVFGRQIPPEPFAYWVWLASAPLMGLVGATYSAPLRDPAPPVAAPLGPAATAMAMPVAAADDRNGSTVGTIAGLGAFLAIGCPVCNKLALVLLGTSGALTIWAPLQPIIGLASLLLLAGTLAWRLRARRSGGACAA